MNTTTDNAIAQSEAVEIGAMIREAREALGYELGDMAAQLHIRIVHLEAIEAGRLSDLPGIPYVSGFLRAYASQLGLDSDDILQRLKASGVNIGKQPTFDILSPVEEGHLPTRSIFFLAAVIGLAAYGGWYYLYSYEGPGNRVADWEISGVSGSGDARSGLSGPPARDIPGPGASPGGPLPSVAGVGEKQTPETAPASRNPPPPPVATGSGFAPTESAPPRKLPADASRSAGQAAPALEPDRLSNRAVTSTPADGADADTASAAGAAPPEDAAAETHASPPAPPPDPALPQASAVEVSAPPDSAGNGEAARLARIVVRAVADSFILVRDEDGNELYSRMMQAGDTYEVPTGENLLLDTGNAGGLRLVIDGQEAPLLGSAGDVLRGVSLDRRLLGR